MSEKRILIVDDERHIVEFLVMSLRQNHYESLIAYDGYEAIAVARSERPDLILLDSMLPGIDGAETCAVLKKDLTTRDIPIIFLTAKSEEDDKVTGLGLGADDYITKPFSLRELFARIEAVLRRSGREPAAGGDDRIRIQDLSIDMESFNVEKSGKKVPLSPTEFSLLTVLSRSPGRVFSKKELAESLNLARETAEGRSLDVHLRNLRKKLGTSPTGLDYIETVRSRGLRAIE